MSEADLEAPLLVREEAEDLSRDKQSDSQKSLTNGSSNGDLLQQSGSERQTAGAPSTSHAAFGSPGDAIFSEYTGPVLCAFHFHKHGEPQ